MATEAVTMFYTRDKPWYGSGTSGRKQRYQNNIAQKCRDNNTRGDAEKHPLFAVQSRMRKLAADAAVRARAVEKTLPCPVI